MCGRITVRTTPEDLASVFGLLRIATKLEGFGPKFNLAPTQLLPVVTNSGQRELDLHQWGLTPVWTKGAGGGAKQKPKARTTLINARAETITQKPAFRAAFRERRCVALVDGFFEWKRDGREKRPHLIRRKDGRPFAMAGIWERGRELSSCAVVTTAANALMAPLHDRMPVILDRDALEIWLRPGVVDASELLPLMLPCSPGDFEAVEVSRLVNSVANDNPECISVVEPNTAEAASRRAIQTSLPF